MIFADVRNMYALPFEGCEVGDGISVYIFTLTSETWSDSFRLLSSQQCFLTFWRITAEGNCCWKNGVVFFILNTIFTAVLFFSSSSPKKQVSQLRWDQCALNFNSNEILTVWFSEVLNFWSAISPASGNCQCHRPIGGNVWGAKIACLRQKD